MAITLGRIEAIFRYPVKSMRGEPLDSVPVGWHGLEGDRRLALRRLNERGGFPWLSASSLPELVLFSPHGLRAEGAEPLPTLVRTPEGEELPAFGEALAADVGRRLGAPVQMMHLRQGVFDEASLSVITSTTVGEVCRLAGIRADMRRFRPNIVVRSAREVPFEEDEWVGGMLAFGDRDDAPRVAVTLRDIRCAMLNFDPDDAGTSPEMLKAVVRTHENTAGIYGTVTRTGRIAAGDAVLLLR